MARRATGRWLIALMFGASPAAAEDAPSLELLLHLAETTDADGQPLEPDAIEAMLAAPAPTAAAAGETPARAPARADTARAPRAEDDDERD